MYAQRYGSVAFLRKFIIRKLVVMLGHFCFTVLRLSSYEFVAGLIFHAIMDLWLMFFKNLLSGLKCIWLEV